jgi:hypothetical protein
VSAANPKRPSGVVFPTLLLFGYGLSSFPRISAGLA